MYIYIIPFYRILSWWCPAPAALFAGREGLDLWTRPGGLLQVGRGATGCCNVHPVASRLLASGIPKTMGNHHVELVNLWSINYQLLKMVLFHAYVGLPEGNRLWVKTLAPGWYPRIAWIYRYSPKYGHNGFWMLLTHPHVNSVSTSNYPKKMVYENFPKSIVILNASWEGLCLICF